jgi:hypothetical protein
LSCAPRQRTSTPCRTFWKYFRSEGKYFEGVVKGVDTELESEEGLIERDFFFEVL